MNICIFGDSWACGEWGWDKDNEYCILHEGITSFLREHGHTVTNAGQGGQSNKFAVSSLKLLIEDNNFDYIFWFKTDPLRDLHPYDFFQAGITYQELISIRDQQTLECYRNLNSLGVTVHCIGGAQKLNTSLILKYSNLVSYIPCLTEWIEPKYKHPEIWVSDWLNLEDRKFDYDLLTELVEGKKMQDGLYKYKKHFWPDGGHPNRVAHKILFNKICDDFNL